MQCFGDNDKKKKSVYVHYRHKIFKYFQSEVGLNSVMQTLRYRDRLTYPAAVAPGHFAKNGVLKPFLWVLR
jgi:hypothetical protein